MPRVTATWAESSLVLFDIRNGWERGILCNKTIYHMYMFFDIVFVVFMFLSHCKWVLLFLMCFYHLVELGVGSLLRCDVM